MALARIKTWIAGETLSAADLNAEFNNILNNGAGSLSSPRTATFDLNGYAAIFDADGDTYLQASSDDLLDLYSQSALLFRFDMDASTPVNGLTFEASAAAGDVKINAQGSDTDISVDIVPKGAGVLKVNGTSITLSGFTTDTIATGDFVPFVDITESNASNKTTIDNMIAAALQLLTDDGTGGAHVDYIPIIDASESNNGNRTRIDSLFANVISNAVAWTTEALSNYHILTRKTDGANLRSINLKTIGAGKQTVWIPAAAMTARTTNGPSVGTTESTTNKVMMKTLDFDQTTQEYAQFTVAFPKSWNESTVTFQPFWTADAGTGTFVATLAAVSLADDDAVDTAFGTAQSSTDTLIATGDVHVGPESSAITVAGTPLVDELVVFQISRDVGTDTLTGDARLIGIKLFFTTDANTDD